MAHYHAKTVHATAEATASAGLRHTSELNRIHIYRRISQWEIKRYDQIFPYLPESSLLGRTVPGACGLVVREECADSFAPHSCLTRIDNEYTEVESPATRRVGT